ncbi:unnamed protein product, partial [Rotaria sordida]
IHRIAPTPTFRLATMSSSQQSQQFIITTAANSLPISQAMTTTGLINNSSMYNSDTTVNQSYPSFIRSTLPSNVLRLTVVRK